LKDAVFIQQEGVVAVKKLVWVILLVAAAVCSALPAAALEPLKDWDRSRLKDLKQDKDKMQWYILDFGQQDSIPYAVSRKYYTNESIKQTTIDLLMSKYGYDAEKAGGLYFTEYGYEYSKDGKQFSTVYLVHGTMNGDYIHTTFFDDSADDKKKVWSAVQNSFAALEGSKLAMPPAAKAPAKKK
jgi:hypothetical protein